MNHLIETGINYSPGSKKNLSSADLYSKISRGW